MSYYDVIEDIYAQISAGDFKSLFNIVAPDAPWLEAENIPYWPGAPLIGQDAVEEAVFDRLANDFAEFHINVIRILAGETAVLVEGRYVGTTKEGKDIDAIFAHVWDFDGDKVVRFQQYSDTYQWRRVLGADA